MNLRDTFRYPHGDPSIVLFAQAIQRWDMAIPQGGRVLELGCCETDFSKWFAQARPDVSLVGVDVNPIPEYFGTFLQQSAESCDFRKGEFDAVLALGAIEHFGLGFYGDPINEHADVETVGNVERWLKSGGWLYFDVPWTPETYYVTANRHFRVYDDTTLQTRLTGGLNRAQIGFASGDRDVWQDVKPTAPMVPYWSVMQLSEKVH